MKRTVRTDLYAADGTVTTTEEVIEVEDRRAFFAHVNAQGEPTPTEVRYESQKGWTTFILVGDGTTNVYASCLNAPEKNHKCASYTAAAVPADATAAQVEEHAFQEAKKMTKFIAGLEGYSYPDGTGGTVKVAGSGCPVHDAPTAVATTEDQAALALTPERINQAITEAITELATGA